ncbi:MAG TPA: replication-relaxation family protein [Planctomycetota bacterium]|nr:replication-relaxation family protein [Planctomycetota bacterium]
MHEYTEADRPAILDLLKVHGPSNAPALAKLRGVNETAVRQQLAVLQREGLVERREERRKRGRPTHLYGLTAKAEALFPNAYGPFALGILRQIRETDGEKKVESLLRKRTQRLARDYRERLRGRPLSDRWQELARIRDEEGYMALVRSRGLVEHHCPIAAIAKEFPLVCQMEKALFEAVLGTKLDRVEHLASGGRACVYARALPGSRPSAP